MNADPRKRASLNPKRPKIPNVKSHQNTHHSKFSLPRLDHDSGPNLKGAWKSLSDAMSIFLTHNSDTVSFHGALSQAMTDADSFFYEFYANIYRNLSSRKQSTQTSVVTPSRALVSSALPFFRAFDDLKKVIIQVSDSGTKSIEETVEAAFADITNTYDSIKQIAADAPSNDPIMKKVQTLTLLIAPIKVSVMQILRKKESVDSQSRLTTELRNYSRTINAAFRNEFSVLMINAGEMESLRSKAYNACSDIIYGMKSITLFDENINRVKKFVSEFDNVLEKECRMNGLINYIGKNQESNQKEEQNIQPIQSYNSSIIPPLKEVKEVETFDIQNINKLSELITKLLNYVNEGGQNQEFLKNSLSECLNKAQIIEKELEKYGSDQFSLLERQLLETREKLNKNQDDSLLQVYKQTLSQGIETLTQNLQDGTASTSSSTSFKYKGEEDLCPIFNNLLTETTSILQKEREYNKQSKFFQREIADLLKLQTTNIDDIKSSLKEKMQMFNYLQEEHEKYNNAMTQKLHERICIIAQEVNVDIGNGEDDVETLDKITDQLQKLQENNSNFEKDACLMLIKLFELDNNKQNYKINNLVFQIKTWYEKEKKLLQNYQECLSDTETRLMNYLGISPSNQPITQSISNLLNQLEQSPTLQSYKKLSSLYNRIQSLNQEQGEAKTLNAGSDYFDQINAIIDQISVQIFNMQKENKTIIKNTSEYRNNIQAIHTKLMHYLNIGDIDSDKNDCSELTLSELITETSELVDEMHEKHQTYVSDDFIKSAFKARNTDDPRSVLMDRSSRLEILEFSIQCLQPFSSILEKALNSSDIGSESWINNLRGYVVSLNEQLNGIASTKINSTIFLFISRFTSLLSSIVPAVSPLSSRKGSI